MEPGTNDQDGLRLASSRAIYALGYVRETGTPRGRGVYASRAIEAGEVVEVCPVLFLQGPFAELPEEIRRVTFDWGSLCGGSPAEVIALGYGGIYNHGNPSNLRFAADQEARCLVFCADQHIPLGAEMTINFNCRDGSCTSEDDRWFKLLGIEPF